MTATRNPFAITEELLPIPDSVLAAAPAKEIEHLQRRLDDTERRAAVAEDSQGNEQQSLLLALGGIDEALERVVDRDQALADNRGLALVGKMFRKLWGENFVEIIEPKKGVPVNPEEHEVIDTVPCPDLEPGSVAQVVTRGYRYNGRAIRSARVVACAPEDSTGG